MLAPIDWIIIAAYLILSLGIGVIFSKKASGGLADYFLAGRKLPWWLAGTSIVATTFASDTPLAVSGFVRRGGIYENWFWWSAVMGGMLSVAFFARLWRRSGVLTDMEFTEMRYSGRSAQALRLVGAVVAGVVANCVTMAWVMLAMLKVASEAFNWPDQIPLPLGGGEWMISGKAVLLGVLLIVALVYTTMSGMWGVVVTDLIQFVIAMAGAIMLAWFVMADLGGPAGLVEKVSAAPGVDMKIFDFFPSWETAGGLAMFTFAVYMSVQWWAQERAATGANQRILSSKDERHATYTVLWGQFAFFVIRPWPWIIVGLASVVYFPLAMQEDPELAYPMMMERFLPAGLMGLMIVSFIAAFMSTIDTSLNWGASYMVNDIYKRFVRDDASPKHYVMVSRVATLLLLILAAVTAMNMESIIGAWKYLATMFAGAGLVVILRWFWWRINAWSEISAMVTSVCLANILPFLPEPLGSSFAVQMVVIVIAATAVWLTVTMLTPPSDPAVLERFFRQVRPGGWWGPIARACPDVVQDRASRGLPAWLAGVLAIYLALFGTGYILLAEYLAGIGLLVGAAIAGWVLFRTIPLGDELDEQDLAASESSSPGAVAPEAVAE